MTLFTSNFEATIELDQKVYSWTDSVFITVVALEHNLDPDSVDEIGNSDLDPLKISTRGFDLDNYKMVETGEDTGIFMGEVILTGFCHDADGDESTGSDGTDGCAVGDDTNPRTEGDGPTGGFLQADDVDDITVSYEFSEGEIAEGTEKIRWKLGEVEWLQESYSADEIGMIRVIDPDMNLDPNAADNFKVNVWSDSDAGGIDLTVIETSEATGIFEGQIFFTPTGESSGQILRVAEGDTVTGIYNDNTLPEPFTTADELDITGTTIIGQATIFVGKIIIIKDTIPDSKHSFFFDSTTLPDQNQGQKGILKLQDDGTPENGLSNSHTFSKLPLEVYDIEELPNPNFLTDVQCEDQSGNVFEPSQLNLFAEGQIITCKFTNTLLEPAG